MIDASTVESALQVQSVLNPGTTPFHGFLFLVEFVVAAVLAYAGMWLLERSGAATVVFAVLFTAMVLVVQTALGSYWWAFTHGELEAAVYTLVFGAVAGFITVLVVFEPEFDEGSGERFWVEKLVLTRIGEKASSDTENQEHSSE
jgi:hypothetical protein